MPLFSDAGLSGLLLQNAHWPNALPALIAQIHNMSLQTNGQPPLCSNLQVPARWVGNGDLPLCSEGLVVGLCEQVAKNLRYFA